MLPFSPEAQLILTFRQVAQSEYGITACELQRTLPYRLPKDINTQV